MKTIKQIADELGVSKQAVHQKRKSKALSTDLQPFTSTVDGVVYISNEGESLIKQAFSQNARKHVDVNEPSTVYSSVDALISMLQAELNTKNKQLDELNTRLAESNAALVAAQQSAQAAQMLHAGTMQKQLTDGEAAASDGEKQTGFISRIFGKRK